MILLVVCRLIRMRRNCSYQAKKSDKGDEKRKLQEVENKRLARTIEKGMRGPIKKLEGLAKDTKERMASTLATMLPPVTQNEIASILQDAQSTLRDGVQVRGSQGAARPSYVAKVDELIGNATKMSL